MENEFDNTPENHPQEPNTGWENTESDKNQPYQGQQQYNYQQYQDNYHYNVGNNTGYNAPYGSGMDTSPMSMGDWVLTILALCIPCAGIVLYFVWAFGKSGNINRRNYCRASLAITGVFLAIYLIFIAIFGLAFFNSIRYY